MIKFVQHIPPMIDYRSEPQKYEVETLDELLAKFKLSDGEVFASDKEGNTLMTSQTKCKFWWVLGFVSGIDLTKYLPKFDEVFKE